MSVPSVLTEIARDLLAQKGIAAIWQLHLDAATLYSRGNEISAATFVEIADIAAEEWRCMMAASRP
jgi:hypothetical protein